MKLLQIAMILLAILSACSDSGSGPIPPLGTGTTSGDTTILAFKDTAVFSPSLWCNTLSTVGDPTLKEGAHSGAFIENGRKMLYGGVDSKSHFDISHWALDESQLKYGLGREYFDALIEPKYYSVSDAQRDNNYASYYRDDERYMLVLTGSEPKVYSIKLLTRHEVINETVDGEPIAVAYCILADLAAVYTRIYHDRELTFALSGYTYSDKFVWNGINAFVLWDRETESLWWPLIDKAVSGLLKGTTLEKYDETKWEETTWERIRSEFPNALVLRPGQTMNTPVNWNRLGCTDFE